MAFRPRGKTMDTSSAKRGTLLAASTILLVCMAIGESCAQMPGGGGGGGFGGHGSGGRHGPQGANKHAPRPDSAPAATPDPLTTFFLGLRALREGMMLRQEQVETWIAMREALRSYIELGPASALASASDIPPLQALHTRVAQARAKADALQQVDGRIAALMPILDANQRTQFETQLTNAFNAGR